ncbi:MAG: AraC family transcriptional regulator [Bacteroidota bacterium]
MMNARLDARPIGGTIHNSKNRVVFWKSLPMLVGGLLCLVSVSCHQKEQSSSSVKVFHQKMASALKMRTKDPRAAIRIMDSVMILVDQSTLHDSDFIEYLQAKSYALLKLNLKDSAAKFMLSIYKDPGVEERKELKVYSGLWLVQELIDDGKYFQANKYLEEIKLLFDHDSVSRGKARTLNLEGTLLNYKGNYPEAQKRFLTSIRIFDNLGDTMATGPVCINLASSFQALGNNKRALYYYRKACDIANTFHDTVNYPIALNNLGALYKNTCLDSVAFYFNKARSLFPSKPWSVEALSARFHLAGIYYDQKKFDLALPIYEDVLKICNQYGIGSGTYRAMAGIGNVYEALNQDEKALEIFKKAYDLTRKSEEILVQLQILEAIRYMHEKMGNIKGAYLDLKNMKTLNDSLFSSEKEIAVYDLERMYDNEKAERKSEALRNQIQLMDQKMLGKTIILTIVILASLLLAFLLYLTYNLYHQRDIAYNALFEKYRSELPNSSVAEYSFPSIKLLPEMISVETGPEYKRLNKYFETDKPFLNCNLRFSHVADQLKISHKKLSNHLEHTGLNFSAFVNHYRVKEALRLLSEPERKNYKVEAIAKECGFGSKASFYKAFSDITGSKPTEYREV